jgi:hypothetical protein
VKDAQDSTPAARRSRINSFLFGSAILYEGLLLVEKMNQQLRRNGTFIQGFKACARSSKTLPTNPASISHGPRHLALLCFTTNQRRIVKSASAFMAGRGKLSRESYL